MKIWSHKKLILAAVIMLFPIGLLCAEPLEITWEWEAADSDVTAFRFQVNSENPEKWIVVDASVTEYTIGPVDDSQEYVLHIQQSYDGEYWSDSAVLAYNPAVYGASDVSGNVIPEKEPEIAEEDLEAQETTQEESFVAMVPAEETAASYDEGFFNDFMVAEDDWTTFEGWDDEPNIAEADEPIQQVTLAPADEEKRTRLDVYAGIGTKFDALFTSAWFNSAGTYQNLKPLMLPSVSIDYVQNNVWPNNKSFDLGYAIGLGFQGYSLDTAGTFITGVDAHGTIVSAYPLSERFSLEAAGGLALLFTSREVHTDTSLDQLGLFIGPMLQLNGRYLISDTWSVGIQAETRFLFGGSFIPYELSGIVRLGVGYQF